MAIQPTTKRTIAFVQGQNLFHSARLAFAYSYPNYDVKALAEAVCKQQGWDLIQTRFYSAIPRKTDDPRWHYFWSKKNRKMGRQGIELVTRQITYRREWVKFPNGKKEKHLVPSSTRFELKIAIDMLRGVREQGYDIALLFCHDPGLAEAVDEVKAIAEQQNRSILVASAFPYNPRRDGPRGVPRTDWIMIEKDLYDSCLDQNPTTV